MSWILMMMMIMMMIEVWRSNSSEARLGPILSEFMHNLKTKSRTIWDQSVEPVQNGGHFKLFRLNLMGPGLIGLKELILGETNLCRWGNIKYLTANSFRGLAILRF